jgi:hypothetical protein
MKPNKTYLWITFDRVGDVWYFDRQMIVEKDPEQMVRRAQAWFEKQVVSNNEKISKGRFLKLCRQFSHSPNIQLSTCQLLALYREVRQFNRRTKIFRALTRRLELCGPSDMPLLEHLYLIVEDVFDDDQDVRMAYMIFDAAISRIESQA